MNKLYRTMSLLFFIMLLSSCSMLLEHRSYVDQMNYQPDDFFVANEDFPVLSGDSGKMGRSRREITKRTPASKHQIEQNIYNQSIKEELKAKEMTLTPQEYDEYNRYKNILKSPSEKLYFLSLDRRDKHDYLKSFSVPSSRKSEQSNARDMRGVSFLRSFHVEKRPLSIGMDKSAVIESWGKPNRIDIAGNPRNQNERWAFISSGERRYVFFEGGRVQGWNLD